MSEAKAVQATSFQPNFRDYLRQHQVTFGLVAISILFYLLTCVITPGFASLSHLFLVLQLAGFLGVVAAGQTVVILISGIDLSIAGVITAVGIFISSMFKSGQLPLAVVIILGLLLASVIGFVNGIGVAKFRIPPLVMTLAVGGIVQGLELVITHGTPTSGTSAALNQIVNKNLWNGFTGTVALWAVVIVLVVWTLNRTRIGRYIYAIGSNNQVANLSGVPVRRVTILAYVFSAVMAGVTGCLLVGYTGIGFSTMGDSYLLPAIAAVVLGGTSILGGKGSYLGTALGAFLLTVVESLLTVVQVSEGARQMIEGLILLLLVVFYTVRSRSYR